MPDDDLDAKRIAQEHQALREAIADINIAWALLENNLAILLCRCMGDDQQFPLASAILFAPTSLEARIAIVEQAFSVAAGRLPIEPEQTKRVLVKWVRFCKRINDQKGFRNHVAHGMITNIAHGGRQHIRMTPPPADSARFYKPRKGHQGPPGYTAHEIQQSVHSVHRMRGQLTQFAILIEHALAGNGAAFEETLQALEQWGH